MPAEIADDLAAFQVQQLEQSAGCGGQDRAVGRNGHRPGSTEEGSRPGPRLQVPQYSPPERRGGQGFASGGKCHCMDLVVHLEGGEMLPRHLPQVEADAAPVSVGIEHVDVDRVHRGVGQVRQTIGAAGRDHAVVIDLDDGLCRSHQSTAGLQLIPQQVDGVRPSRGNPQAQLVKPVRVAELEPDGNARRAFRIDLRGEQPDGWPRSRLDSHMGVEVGMGGQELGAARRQGVR